jgi:hypothetical protein
MRCGWNLPKSAATARRLVMKFFMLGPGLTRFDGRWNILEVKSLRVKEFKSFLRLEPIVKDTAWEALGAHDAFGLRGLRVNEKARRIIYLFLVGFTRIKSDLIEVEETLLP